jgi:hypothetical protein
VVVTVKDSRCYPAKVVSTPKVGFTCTGGVIKLVPLRRQKVIVLAAQAKLRLIVPLSSRILRHLS